MQLHFLYPEKLESLDILLATKAYEAIWQDDHSKILERFTHYTGLEFQQKSIDVEAHDGVSMSGKDDVPMRLNARNDTLVKQRNALTHELAHRLLFGNGLYAPDESSPTDNDEIRVLLFQGDVLQDLYGHAEYDYWANVDPADRVEEHLKDMRYVLSLSKAERQQILHTLISSSTTRLLY